jgi:hypothetical protein
MDDRRPRVRSLVGRLLVSLAIVMLVLAAAFYFEWVPIDPAAKTIVAAALVMAAAVDAALGLRFLGEAR